MSLRRQVSSQINQSELIGQVTGVKFSPCDNFLMKMDIRMPHVPTSLINKHSYMYMTSVFL